MRTDDVLELQAVIKIISEYRFGCKAMRSSYSEEPKPTKNRGGSEKLCVIRKKQPKHRERVFARHSSCVTAFQILCGDYPRQKSSASLPSLCMRHGGRLLAFNAPLSPGFMPGGEPRTVRGIRMTKWQRSDQERGRKGKKFPLTTGGHRR